MAVPLWGADRILRGHPRAPELSLACVPPTGQPSPFPAELRKEPWQYGGHQSECTFVVTFKVPSEACPQLSLRPYRMCLNPVPGPSWCRQVHPCSSKAMLRDPAYPGPCPLPEEGWKPRSLWAASDAFLASPGSPEVRFAPGPASVAFRGAERCRCRGLTAMAHICVV